MGQGGYGLYQGWTYCYRVSQHVGSYFVLEEEPGKWERSQGSSCRALGYGGCIKASNIDVLIC